MRFTAPDLATAHHWVNVLDAAGIGCELHNRFATGALGGLPPDQCAPEIWLHDERDTALARRILEAARSGPPAGATRWRCARLRRGARRTVHGLLALRADPRSA